MYIYVWEYHESQDEATVILFFFFTYVYVQERLYIPRGKISIPSAGLVSHADGIK